jgi:diguanylate cyclase (GGDEF)-like protein
MLMNHVDRLRLGSLRDAAIALGAQLVRRVALHDLLTGLPNRTLLCDRLGQELARARREGGLVAVLLLDLDRFRDINDTLGHPAGDRLLCAVGQRISAAVRATDTLARLGGDEFVLIQPQSRTMADVAALADKVLATLAMPFDLAGQEVHLSTSIGVALFPQDGPDPDSLLQHAELALYRAKAQGRHQARFFEPAMDEEAQARRRLERELRQGLQRGEFVLHYQPQLELATGCFAGVEALVRWHHPERGLVPPGAFIPAAEASGLIRPLGAWVLREACRQANAWHGRGWELSVAVNLSPAQLRQSGVLPVIGEALAAAGLEPGRLELEITEGVLMENVEQTGDGFLRRLTADGIRLALDDFGIGYSSLAYLKHLPVKTIKIDRSFVRDLGQDADALALVRAIVMLGHSLRKKVVAEGVENATQLEILRELGCDEAQGYHIARPMDAHQLERLLATSGNGYQLGAGRPSASAAGWPAGPQPCRSPSPAATAVWPVTAAPDPPRRMAREMGAR